MCVDWCPEIFCWRHFSVALILVLVLKMGDKQSSASPLRAGFKLSSIKNKKLIRSWGETAIPKLKAAVLNVRFCFEEQCATFLPFSLRVFGADLPCLLSKLSIQEKDFRLSRHLAQRLQRPASSAPAAAIGTQPLRCTGASLSGRLPAAEIQRDRKRPSSVHWNNELQISSYSFCFPLCVLHFVEFTRGFLVALRPTAVYRLMIQHIDPILYIGTI